ncbi:MAG: tetratricopeptide repeat protein [Rhodospirillales bacterium]|nr:tetratricopeptide repeat protein [Rhodospirillales bacterium]
MAEKTEDDLLFQEIDEELRQDQFHKLWRKYGKFAMAGTVAAILGVAGFQGWRAYDISSRNAEGERFAAAQDLVQKNQWQPAEKAFADIAANGKAAYPFLARFQKARLLARQGKNAAAGQAYKALADDGSLDPVYRDLAVILGSLQELNNKSADFQGMENRLKPLLAETNPWRFSAGEITGLLAMRSGDKDRARKTFKGLNQDRKSPQGVRARAQEMLSIIGK